jgi:transcriptional regulator GlxA family with amidase domain
MALKSVSALVLDGLAIFEFGVICEVFGIDRSADGVPNFDFKVCGPAPGMSLRTSVGATITPDHGLDELIGADLVAIPAISSQYGGYLPAALDAVRKAAESGSIILTVCSGAFVAGAAGLLDGRPCTTHWMHADELAQMYPTAKVDRNVLFVDDGDLITSAGTAAGIDACLHLVRRELGSEVTNKIARRMVVPPQRDGGQRQYIDQPIPVRCSEGFAPHLDWILTNLERPHTVATLSTRAHMSARTFARRFVEETGRTPMQWVTDQRVLYARRLLEETDLDIDRIADRSGFGTATLLRHHFRRIIGVTPSDYRRRFSCSGPCEEAAATA